MTFVRHHRLAIGIFLGLSLGWQAPAWSWEIYDPETNKMYLMAPPVPATIQHGDPVKPIAPTVTASPDDRTVTVGQATTFVATFAGTDPRVYKWQVALGAGSFTTISGATNWMYTLSTTTLADNGKMFRCVVTNSTGTATSAAAKLTVVPPNNLPPVVGTVATLSADVSSTTSGIQHYAGSTVTYKTTVSDPENKPLTWQWYYTVNTSTSRFKFGLPGTSTGTVKTVVTYPLNAAWAQYKWTLRATDNVGLWKERNINVSIIPSTTTNFAPVVSGISPMPVDVSTATGNQQFVGSTVTYSSRVSDLERKPITWQWYYTRNTSTTRVPVGPLGKSTGTVKAVFIYPTNVAGSTYKWILRVTDNKGLATEQNLTTSMINRPPNQAPVVAAITTADMSTTTAGFQQYTDTLTTYSTLVSDPESGPFSWQWFHTIGTSTVRVPVGKVGTSTMPVRANFTYPATKAGATYKWILRATDSKGLWTEKSLTVSILVKPLPPVVGSITTAPTDVSSTTPGVQLYANTPITFSTTVSDPEKGPINWQWFYTADPSPIRYVSTAPGTSTGTVKFTGNFAGNQAGFKYTFILRATDKQGLSTEKSLTVSINAKPNLPPVVAPITIYPGEVSPTTPGIQQYAGSAGLAYYRSTVSDPEGGPITWQWYYTADPQTTRYTSGSPGTSTGTLNFPAAYALNQAGYQYTWILRVTDNTGAWTEKSMPVMVIAPAAMNIEMSSPADSLLNVSMSLPDSVQMSGMLSVTASNLSSVSGFEWTITPMESSGGFGSPRSPAASSGATLKVQTPNQTMALAEHSFSAGLHSVTVRAFDSQGRYTPAVQKNVAFLIDNLAGFRVRPNPWRLRTHGGSNIPVTFDGLPVGGQIKIFTVSSQWVRTVSYPEITWDLKNSSGDLVASGIYLYVVTTPEGEKKTGQLVIIK